FWRAAAALVAAFVFVAGAQATDRTLDIPTHLQQGQLVIGHAPKGAKIEFQGRRLRIGADGVFAFGIERDAPAQLALHVRYSDGKAHSVALKIAKREYKIERVEGLPPKTVTPDPETAKRIEREQARVAEARRRDDEREDFLAGFTLPVEG